MRFGCRVAYSDPLALAGLPPYSARRVFTPPALQTHAEYIWAAMTQLDRQTMLRAHRLHARGCKRALMLDLCVASPAAMAQLPFCRQQRALTDVVAYPDPLVQRSAYAEQFENLGHDDVIGDILAGSDHDDGAGHEMGTIFICPQYIVNLRLRGCEAAARATRGARSKGMAGVDEYVLCALTHSMLHLVGYMHDTQEQFDDMIAVERKVAKRVAGWMSEDDSLMCE